MPFEQQSPINLTAPIFADLGQEAIRIRWKKKLKPLLVSQDHGGKVYFAAGNGQRVRLQGKDYELVEFHFHHPSEHWVDGRQQTVELHVVNRRVDDGAHHIVIGVFLEPDDTAADPQLTKLLDQLTVTPVPASLTVPLHALLPANVDAYYRYEGSLTTPEYGETVSWAVMRDSLHVGSDTLKRFIAKFTHSARAVQPLNRRFVLASLQTAGDKPLLAAKQRAKKRR